MDRSVLERKPMTELRDIAAHLEMRGYQRLRKADLIDAIVESGTNGGGGEQQVLETGQRASATPDDRSDASASDASPSDAGRSGDGGSDAGGAERTRTRSRTRSRGEDGAGGDGGAGGGAGGDAGDGESAKKVTPPAGTDAGEAGGGADAAADDGDGDDDDDGGSGRKRRNRRDRRRRNRDRQDDEESQGQGGGGGDVGEVRAGVLDILPEGYGFLRTTGYLPGERDVYVSQGQIRKQGLRRGDVVQGPIRPQRNNEKVPALHHVQRVNGEGLEDGQVPGRPSFEELGSDGPKERLDLAAGDRTLPRAVDLLAPIGTGQRALLVAGAPADGVAELRDLGAALADALGEGHLMYVLVDARPEDVAAAEDAIDGEVISSTFDQPAEDHCQIADLAVERARRLVELGHDVVLVVDSATRLARANAVTTSNSQKLIAPDVEAASLYAVKRLLASARSVPDGGSLTVLAGVHTGTGSPHDDVIARELRRTANAEIVLDGDLARQRVAPPISVLDSGTRDEADLVDDERLAALAALRREAAELDARAAVQLVLDRVAGDAAGGA